MPTDAITASFARLLAARPDAPAIVSPGRLLTRAGLSGIVRAALGPLLEAGLPPGSLVGLSAPNGPGFVASVLALWQAELAVLLLDQASPPQHRRATSLALGAQALLECEAAWPAEPRDWTLTRLSHETFGLPREIAVVKLTSGSTGAPRGVAVSCQALLADEAALATSMELRPDDRTLGAIPMSHSYGFASVVLPLLARGSAIVVPDQAGPWGALRAAAHAQATVFPTAPAYLQALLRTSLPPVWPASVRLVISASAPLSPSTAARFRETYAQPVHVFYGASESGGISYDREGTAGERGTVGTPVAGVRLELATPEAGATGEGVVSVRSEAVGWNYLPQPDPRLANGRFRTGDLACFEGAELRLLGRVDAIINVRGHKVNPAEIEQVLLSLRGVEEVLVVGVPDAERGGEMLRALIGCPSHRVTAADVVAFCRGRLPDHKVPRSVLLVDALPRTSRGKLSPLGADECVVDGAGAPRG
jgi:long-chain acyl-CoA synthetase